MGLDISIYSKQQFDESKRIDAAWDAWKEGEPKPERDEVAPDALTEERKSDLHPDNICNPVYLRSSYNESGFNSAVPAFLLDSEATYYGILAPVVGDDPGPTYWHEVTDPGKVLLAQDRARDVARRLRAVENPLQVLSVYNHGRSTMDKVDAAKWVADELSKPKGWDGDYSNAVGLISPGGITVHGVTVSSRGDILLVVKAVDSDGEKWTRHYADSAEVLAEEFCDTILKLIERDGVAYIGWSG